MFVRERILRILTSARLIHMKQTVMLVVLLISTVFSMASEEQNLGWTSVVVRCGRTQEAGEVSCEMEVAGDGWKRFVIQAFGAKHTLTASDLEKLKEFPLSSLRTSHEAGYERLGGHRVHFRFNRTFYNSEKKLVTETISVSATKNGVTVNAPGIVDHKGEQGGASNGR
jgi:hypothetical protein